MILNDWMIRKLAQTEGMIEPFAESSPPGQISYGLTSFGYDFRLARGGLKVYSMTDQVLKHNQYFVDPKDKRTAEMFLESVPDPAPGDPYILKPHETYLGYSVEKFAIPANVITITIGKSTYARCGILLNVTPAEPEWKGHLTLEISNLSDAAVAVYPDEGIAQMLFLYGMKPEITYANKRGKYQNQGAQVVLPTVTKPTTDTQANHV